MSEVTQRIADEVANEFESFGPDGTRTIEETLGKDAERAKFDPIVLQSGVLGSFEAFVASLNRPQDVRHVAELVGSIQILLARFNDFDLKQAAQHSLVSLLLDAAKVTLLNDKIYDYARFVDDTSFGIVGHITPSAAWDQIHGKAQGLVFLRQSPDRFFPELKQQIDSYKEAGVSPWNQKFDD